MKRIKPIIDKNAPGMDSILYNPTSKPKKMKKNKSKHLPSEVMDKESKQIQSGRAAKGGKGKKKTKLLKRVSMRKGGKYPAKNIETEAKDSKR